MKRLLLTAALAFVIGAPAFAQAPPPAEEKGLPMLAMTKAPAKGGGKLTVTTPAFKTGADIPFKNTQYQGNVFPGLEWTKGPAATKSYAIVMQDTDGIRNDQPILHWTMWNIKGTKLDAGMTTAPDGSAFGPNIRGPKHRYHIQVFALDTTVDATKTYDELLTAISGHVLASGEVIGLGQVDPSAPPPPPRPASPPASPPSN
jgi:phosphatidylethanolamine-binding protein (PEBP) family uncharacterized protein